MWRWLTRRIDALLAEFFSGPQVPTPAPRPWVTTEQQRRGEVLVPPSRWSALPGNRLALRGGSGIEILLNPPGDPYLFTLVDSAGRAIAKAGDLVPLKAHGERLALQLSEFQWKDGWQ